MKQMGDAEMVMTERVERASATFAQGYNCSQAVLAAFAPDLGLDEQTALRLASPFGGGIAQQGDTCGAVSGALMALGLRYGRMRAEDRQAQETAYGKAKELLRRFAERHGAVTCRELLECDVRVPAEMERARREGSVQEPMPTLRTRHGRDRRGSAVTPRTR